MNYCWLSLFRWLILAKLVCISASSEATDTELKIPNLPLGDINVVVLTDTHSWVGGHSEKEALDANYGDVLSFYRMLQAQMEAIEAARNQDDQDSPKHDLFFVMNGDWIDGTGLAMNGDPSSLIPILERMPWDAVNIGNHELYRKSVIEYMKRPGGFVEWFGERYITSNVIMTDSKKAVGNAYRLLKGKHSNVLVFGFLYDMTNNDPTVTVLKVEETVTASWFEVALRDSSYDAILVLAHCGFDDPLITVILNRIRHLVGEDMPVQFITGHTHVRAVSTPGNYSSSFEAGRYLDTVGFVSFPTQSTIQKAAAAAKQAEAEKIAAEQAAAAAAANATHPTDRPNTTHPTDRPNTTHPTDNPGTESSNGSGVEWVTQAPTSYPTNEPVNEPSDEPGTDPTGAVGTDPTHGQGNRRIQWTEDTNVTKTTNSTNSTPSIHINDKFQHVFIDATFNALADVLGVSFMATAEGVALSSFILNIQDDLGLFKIVGCIEDDHLLEKAVYEDNSLWGLFCSNVVPHVFPYSTPPNQTTNAKNESQTKHSNPKVVLLGQGIWRYDLLAKELLLDEVLAVSPFNDTMFVFPAVPGSVVHQVNLSLNLLPGTVPQLPNYVMCPSPTATNAHNPTSSVVANELEYDLVTSQFDVPAIRQMLQELWPDDSDMPEAESLSPLTSTSMWLDFFDRTDLCQTENKGTHKPQKPRHPNHNKTVDTHVSSSSSTADRESELDLERIDFFWIAMAVVALFGGIYIRQRTLLWRIEEQDRERAVRQALEEYNEQHGYGGYRDGDGGGGENNDDYDPQRHLSSDDDIQHRHLEREQNGGYASHGPEPPVDLLDFDHNFTITDDDDTTTEQVRLSDQRILELL